MSAHIWRREEENSGVYHIAIWGWDTAKNLLIFSHLLCVYHIRMHVMIIILTSQPTKQILLYKSNNIQKL